MSAAPLPFGYSLRSPSPLFVPATPSSSSLASTAHYPIKVEDYISASEPFTTLLAINSSSSSSTPSSSSSISSRRMQTRPSEHNGASPTPPRRPSPPMFRQENRDDDAEENMRRKRRRVQPRLRAFESFLDEPGYNHDPAAMWMSNHEFVDANPRPDFIDLTDDPNPLARHTEREVQAAQTLESLKRKGRPQRSSRAVALASSSDLGSRDRPILLDDADELEDQLSRKLEAHQERARQQELAALEASKREGSKKTTFSTMNCVICMDVPTDLTMVSCGHVFCHECILQALKASETQQLDRLGVRRAKCPVCRKTTNRKAQHSLVPLLLQKGKRKDKARTVDDAAEATDLFVSRKFM